MKNIIGIRRLIISIFFTVIAVCLLSFAYCDRSLLKGFMISRYQNGNANIEIVNSGNDKNTVKILSDTAHESSISCNDDKGSCSVLNVPDKWREYTVRFKVIGDGNITIRLKSQDKRKIPFTIDYGNFEVNGKQIFDRQKSLWLDKSYDHGFAAKNGDIAEFKVQIRKHHFRISDLKRAGFNWLMFLSVLILSFLLSYKLVQYIARFKILENNSRIDIVFVIVFGLLLFLPASHISVAEKSLSENRMLAKAPKMIVNGSLNHQYTKQFEEWFNDRFLGREYIIRIYENILYFFNTVYQNKRIYFFKDTGYIFHKTHYPFPPPHTSIRIKKITDAVRRLDDLCKDHNIRLYVLIVPLKESIYPEFGELGYDTEKEAAFQYYIKQIQNALPDQRIIYPYDELKQGKTEDFVFFKQTHHWTDFGAFLGYRKLAERIVRDFPEFKQMLLDEYNVSFSEKIRDGWSRDYDYTKKWGINLLGISDKELFKTRYRYYDPKKSETVEKRGKYIKEFSNREAGNNYRLFMTGHSQNENLLQFLTSSVKETKYLRLNLGYIPEKEQNKFMKHYKRELIDFKPDIIVITISSGMIDSLSDFFKD